MKTRIRLLPLIFLLLAACNNGDDGPDNTPNPQPNDGDYYLAFTRVDKSTGASCRIVASHNNAVLANAEEFDASDWLLYSDNAASDWNEDWEINVNFFAFNNDERCPEKLEPLLFRIAFEDSMPVIGQNYVVQNDDFLGIYAGFVNFNECDQAGAIQSRFTLTEIDEQGRASGTFSMENDCEEIIEGVFRYIPYAERSII